MKCLEIVTLDEIEKWNTLVKTFKSYDVYYLNDYVKAFNIHGDGEPFLFYFENETTRAINVVLKRDIANAEPLKDKLNKNTYFDLTTPYGYGGFLIEGNDFKTLNEEYTSYCRNENIICEFVRYHPLLENWLGFELMYDQVHLGETVYLETTSEDLIWKNISSKNRNVIRKAQKSGLRTYWCRAPQIIQPFMEIYKTTMDKDEADLYYYFEKPFYESVLEDLKQNAMWFYTELDGVIASIAIILFCNGKVHYHLSAARKAYMRYAPTNLLLYDVAKWACENGYKKLHLGGGVNSEHDSLYKFKKAFNRGEDSEFWIGKKIFNQVLYEELVGLRGQLDECSQFFPKYRQ
ncbi:MAG: GNAT family N-acetyltransferase [Eubacterium sp.]